jgi:hypothetical protein
MADKKISALTSAATPLDGTEVLPIVQSGATVKVANNDLRPKQLQSNATSGVMQITGPAAASTRVMTTPDANFTVARTDAGQTFTGNQTVTGTLQLGTGSSAITEGGNYTIGTSAVQISRTSAQGGIAMITGFNTATGQQGTWLVSWNNTLGTAVINSNDGTGLVATFSLIGTAALGMAVVSGQLSVAVWAFTK